MNNRKLVLENGRVFDGVGFGSLNEVVAEIIYNTAVVGYQEIISDPANCGKMVCMTYPLIGNYGLTDEDYESKHICTKGLIVREYNEVPSNFRYTRTLGEVLEENNVSGIEGVDTRSLMKLISEKGSMKALICDIDKPLEDCMQILNDYQEADDLACEVTSKKVWYSRTPNPIYNVAVIDLGTKLNLIKGLNNVGCNVISFPYNTTKEEILKYKPNGLFISSGPGNPEKLTEVIQLIKSFIGIIPIYGVGLGHQLIGLAYGASTYKMKCGHHGCNYPVKNLETGRIEISTQNHMYTVDRESIKNTNLTVTHENVITKEIEGLQDLKNKVMSIEFEPITIIDENTENIFKKFIDLMKNGGGKKNA
ncbi:MAG: glutamine-hydrolyzing carbamoyl-phosphate synthase small subunit [Bacilli bacterium]|nr:glutamine-hydrolyzing carbamoyl-phosphate synthase small subunit [Bacilli bacterium]